MRVLRFIWSLPIKIIKSRVLPLNMDHEESATKKPRRRPLQTCGASISAIAEKSFTKAQAIDGVIGSIARTAVRLFGFIIPFLYSMLYKWLAVSSFVDDYIIAIENLVETIFPSSKSLFDKIDSLVHGAEALPEKFDDLCRKFPTILHQFHFLDWIFGKPITPLCESNNTREKEITIDLNYNGRSEPEEMESHCPVRSEEDLKFIKDSNVVQITEMEESASKDIRVEPSVADLSHVIHKSLERLHSLENKRKSGDAFADSPCYGSFKSAVSSPMSDDENGPFGKCSYRDMVKKGSNENRGEDGGNAENDFGKVLLKDQIVELFEEGLHLM